MTDSIIDLVAEERKRQKSLGYTDATDDALGLHDWVALCARHLGLAVSDGASLNKARWRRQMIRLAAVCVAALEADARTGQPWRNLIPLAQEIARKTGEAVIIVPHGESMEFTGSLGYITALSQADSREIRRAVWQEPQVEA